MPVEDTGRRESHPKDWVADRDGEAPLQGVGMSKQDKDILENGYSDETISPDYTSDQTGPAFMADEDSAKSERSRLFNLWLDRTLPLLQELLGGSTTGAVTSPGNKPKH